MSQHDYKRPIIWGLNAKQLWLHYFLMSILSALSYIIILYRSLPSNFRFLKDNIKPYIENMHWFYYVPTMIAIILLMFIYDFYCKKKHWPGKNDVSYYFGKYVLTSFLTTTLVDILKVIFMLVIFKL